MQKILAMLIVAVSKKSQCNRFMLESFAQQCYDCDKLKTAGLIGVLGRSQFGICHYIKLLPMRLPSDLLDKVVYYLYALDEVIFN